MTPRFITTQDQQVYNLCIKQATEFQIFKHCNTCVVSISANLLLILCRHKSHSEFVYSVYCRLTRNAQNRGRS